MKSGSCVFLEDWDWSWGPQFESDRAWRGSKGKFVNEETSGFVLLSKGHILWRIWQRRYDFCVDGFDTEQAWR